MKVKIIEQAMDFDMSQIKGGSTICAPYTESRCAWYHTCGTQPTTASMLSVSDSYYSTDGTECVGYYTWKEWCIVA